MALDITLDIFLDIFFNFRKFTDVTRTVGMNFGYGKLEDMMQLENGFCCYRSGSQGYIVFIWLITAAYD